MCGVSAAVAWQRQSGEEEVDGREALIVNALVGTVSVVFHAANTHHVQVMIQFGKLGRQFLAHLLSLQGPRGCEQCDLRHGGGDVNNTRRTLPRGRRLDIILHLGLNQGDMRLQSLLRQSKLDKLLLFHELGVWAIVNNIAPKHRYRERAVNLLGVHVLELAVEDELVTLDSKVTGDFPTEEDKGEDVAILFWSSG